MSRLFILTLLAMSSLSANAAVQEEYGYRFVVCQSSSHKIDMIVQSEALAGLVRITENMLDDHGEIETTEFRAFRATGMGPQSRLVVSRETGPIKSDSKVLSLVFKTADYLKKSKFPVEMAEGTADDILRPLPNVKFEKGSCTVKKSKLTN